MTGDQAQRQRRLPIGIEIGPIHRHNNVPACADDLRNPMAEQLPDIDALIAQQAIDLFYGMLGQKPTHLR